MGCRGFASGASRYDLLMELTTAQLRAGAAHVAAILDPAYDELLPGQQARQRTAVLEWLNPCLLGLPDLLATNELLAGDQEEAMREAAEAFLLIGMRRNEKLDPYSDEDLRRRIGREDLSRAIQNLTYLTAHFLDACDLADWATPALEHLEDFTADNFDEALVAFLAEMQVR